MSKIIFVAITKLEDWIFVSSLPVRCQTHNTSICRQQNSKKKTCKNQSRISLAVSNPRTQWQPITRHSIVCIATQCQEEKHPHCFAHISIRQTMHNIDSIGAAVSPRKVMPFIPFFLSVYIDFELCSEFWYWILNRKLIGCEITRCSPNNCHTRTVNTHWQSLNIDSFFPLSMCPYVSLYSGALTLEVWSCVCPEMRKVLHTWQWPGEYVICAL